MWSLKLFEVLRIIAPILRSELHHQLVKAFSRLISAQSIVMGFDNHLSRCNKVCVMTKAGLGLHSHFNTKVRGIITQFCELSEK